MLTYKENCALKLVDEIILYYDARSKKLQTENRVNDALTTVLKTLKIVLNTLKIVLNTLKVVLNTLQPVSHTHTTVIEFIPFFL